MIIYEKNNSLNIKFNNFITTDNEPDLKISEDSNNIGNKNIIDNSAYGKYYYISNLPEDGESADHGRNIDFKLTQKWFCESTDIRGTIYRYNNSECRMENVNGIPTFVVDSELHGKFRVTKDKVYTIDNYTPSSAIIQLYLIGEKNQKVNPIDSDLMPTGNIVYNMDGSTKGEIFNVTSPDSLLYRFGKYANCCHVEGVGTFSDYEASHAEGSGTKALSSSAHSEGYESFATGLCSHAEGSSTKAISEASHAEGVETMASGDGSHSEGYQTMASGDASHAEGNGTTASSDSSHAEGHYCEASGMYSHAEGSTTYAYGNGSHSEGIGTTASRDGSHTEGTYNIEDIDGYYIHIVGNGDEYEESNANTLDEYGDCWYQGSVTSTGADYAEYFEWEDGNPENEDRVGRVVTLNGDKIKFAEKSDYTLGVISGTAGIIGDNSECEWNGKYLKDDFGRIILTKNTEKQHNNKKDNTLTSIKSKKKINPDYDNSKKYIRRKDRPEWDTVGMLGKLHVLDDGSCKVNSYAKVGKKGILTNSESPTNMRVMKRITNSIVLVLFK